MTARQINAVTCRCAAAVLASCLLAAACGSAGTRSGLAGPTTPLVMGGQLLVTGTRPTSAPSPAPTP